MPMRREYTGLNPLLENENPQLAESGFPCIITLHAPQPMLSRRSTVVYNDIG